MIGILFAAATIPDEKPGDKVVLTLVLVAMLGLAFLVLKGINAFPMWLRFCLVGAVLLTLYVISTNLPF